jgi:cell division septum initiation protein DivIVA
VSFNEYDGGPGGAGARRPERLSAEQIDAWEFPRAGLTHRGYDEEGVLRFKRRVLGELQAAAQIEAELRQRNDELTNQLRTSYAGSDPANGGAAAAPTAAPTSFAPEQRVTAAAVNAIAMAQRQAEEQIRAAEEYVRNVTEYARNQYAVTVNEGHRQGLLAAESAFQRRSEQLSTSLKSLEQQLEFLKAFGVAFGVQVEGALEKAREEVHVMIKNIHQAFDALSRNPPAGAGAPPAGMPGMPGMPGMAGVAGVAGYHAGSALPGTA